MELHCIEDYQIIQMTQMRDAIKFEVLHCLMIPC